jgi:thymidylate synthase (FAD)
MKIIEPQAIIETPIDGDAGKAILQLIERAARTCYKSEGKMTDDSAADFVRKITQVRKHHSVVEHASATVRFIVDRGVSHELVRHRIAAFSQESTRYCNYCGDKFGKEITVIQPIFWDVGTVQWMQWKFACEAAESNYFALIEGGATPQEARSVLPNSLKTEVVMTCNMREWRHVFSMRAASMAHPQMQQVMKPLLAEFKRCLPPLFDDLQPS